MSALKDKGEQNMFIIPAIDLYKGEVVRLTKGNKANCKVYSQDPLSVAKSWYNQGAKWLHLVDLSAAFSIGNNRKAIAEIVKVLDIPIELGGGIRSLETIKEMLGLGIERLILGTKATDSEFLKKALKIASPERLVVALDEKEGKVAIAGWEKSFDLAVDSYLDYLKGNGVKRVIYTDVSCDGTLEGMNFDKIKKFQDESEVKFIFAGGVSCLEDIKMLKAKASFTEGLIVGKALYEQKFKLKEAIDIAA